MVNSARLGEIRARLAIFMAKKYVILAVLLFCAAPDAGAREAAFAGKFYPSGRAELSAFADKALAGCPAASPSEKTVAVLAPHAGFVYSGRIAACAYTAAAENYDLVVILGPAHTKAVRGAALLASGFYETPLGRVQVDEEFSRALMAAEPLFYDDPAAHAAEHSVEVQLPFLQRRLKKPFRLAAALLNSDDPAAPAKIGAALAAKLKGRRALLVISSDMSHYPGHETARAADLTQALALETMSAEYFLLTGKVLLAKGAPGLETCACGGAAIAAGLEAAKRLGAGEFVTLKYADSFDTFPEAATKERVVGYLAGAFVKKAKAAPYTIKYDAARREALLAEARKAVAASLEGEKPAPVFEKTDYALNLPAAVFVTLTKNGVLRGCVGTVEPVMALVDAVKYAALSAAFADRRFEPLAKEELSEVRMEISALSPLQRTASAKNITPSLHGVVVRGGGRSGLFLPQVWEQIPNKEEFLGELCSQKAGLPRDCWKDPKTELYTFTVDAFSEK